MSNDIKFNLKHFKTFFSENKYKLFTIFLIYCSVVLSIGIVNFPYIDDVRRQQDGYTGFAEAYCRWGSEFILWLIQGSRHLTDLGLTTHIITAFILSLSSIIAVYVLNDKKIKWVPLICSIMIGVNPWFLQCISFRFDSPYMALSILFSLIPFLWWNKNQKIFLLVSILGIFFTCNTYQASLGIYIIMVVALCVKGLLRGKTLFLISKKCFYSTIAYIISMIFYVIETKFNPSLLDRGERVKIANFKEIPFFL